MSIHTQSFALIGKQQLEIEQLKAQNKEMCRVFALIHNRLVCIGGPLNDNFNGYTTEQKKIFHDIEGDILEEWVETGNER